ncbi:hypothetical protein RUND412_002331 [Rhizina undulata]
MASNSIETRHYINGEFVESVGGHTFPIHNPATFAHVANVCEARAADVDIAVDAATAAFPLWSALPAHVRAGHLTKLAALVRASATELAKLDSLCMGRTLSSALAFDSAYSAQALDYFAQVAATINGETVGTGEDGKFGLTIKQPFGVCGAIIPWNVPVMMFVQKVGAAVAVGNTVVLKSSEKAPLSSLYMAKLFHEAGFPKGVVNVLSGFGSPCGEAISEHMKIRKVSFTGSTMTGRKVMAAAAKSNLKSVTMELGGKSPTLVFPDADIKDAAQRIAFSIAFLTGQACIANSRVYVHEEVMEEFVGYFRPTFEHLAKPLFNPSQLGEGVGPVADKLQFERVMGFIEEGKKEGGLVSGGERVGDKGYFIAPTIFTKLPSTSRLMKEEIFGPVVQLNTFKTEAEAIALANDSEFGLYGSVFTKDLARALRVVKALEAGNVGVNTTSPDLARNLPFGGFKGSGLGVEGWKYALESYVETKAVTIRYGE